MNGGARSSGTMSRTQMSIVTKNRTETLLWTRTTVPYSHSLLLYIPSPTFLPFFYLISSILHICFFHYPLLSFSCLILLFGSLFLPLPLFPIYISSLFSNLIHLSIHPPTSLTHAAEPFLRSCQLCSHSRTSQHFMEPQSSLPCSQEPSTGPYSEGDQSKPYHPTPSL
jgi:hypothetical protein